MGKLQAISSPAEFVSMVRQSKLLTDAECGKLDAAAKKTSDSKAIARQLVKIGKLTSWQAGQLLAGWHRLRIGKYRLRSQLGRSVLGRTFLAEHESMARRVVIKTLSAKHTSNPKIVKKFLAVSQSAAVLDHRNIIHVYDVDSEGDQYYVVMEFSEGQDLHRLIENDGPLPVNKVASYVVQVAKGLAYAHEQEVVHYDIKPSNLLLDNQGVVKILDMGIGSLAKYKAKGKSANDESGDSAVFVAPEQLDRKAEVDHRVDIYSLGRVANFLLTGHVSDDGEGLDWSGAAPDLAEVLQSMTEADPEIRPQSAVEVAQVVQEWLNQNSAADLSGDIEDFVPNDTSASLETVTDIDVRPAPAKQKAKAAGKAASKKKPAARAATVQAKSKPEKSNGAPKVAKPLVAKPLEAKPKAAAELKQKPAAAKQNPAVAKKKERQVAIDAGEKKKAAAAPAIAVDAKASPANRGKTSKSPAEASAGEKAAANTGPTIDAGKPAPAPVSDFDFGGKSKRGGKRKKKTKSPVTNVSADTADGNDTKVERKPLPVGLIIGGSVGGGVVVVGIIVAVLFLFVFNGSDEPEVASAEGAPAAAAETNEDSTNNSSAINLDDALDFNDGAPDEDTSDDTIDAVPEEPADPDAENKEPAPAEEKPSEPVDGDGGTTGEDPKETEPPETTDVETKKPNENPDEPAKTPEDDPNAKPPTEEKPEPKPEPSPPKKPEPKKTADPFKGFAKSLELPAIGDSGAGEPTEIGKIKNQPTDLIFIRLNGGQSAYKEGSEFYLRNGNSGTAERDWEFQLEGAKGGGETTVALLSLQEEKLMFNWTEAAATQPAASYLKNCSLTMDLDQDSHDVLLRQPIDSKPISISLDKAIPSAKLSLDSPPNPEQLLVEFISIEGLPKYSLDPPQPISAQGGSQWIRFGETINDQVLSIQVESKLTRVLELKFTPYIKLPNQAKPQKFNKAILSKIKKELVGTLQVINFRLNQLKAADAQIKDRKQKQGLAAQISLGEQELQKTTLASQQFTKLEALVGNASAGTIQYRVFYDTGTTQIELMRSKAGVE